MADVVRKISTDTNVPEGQVRDVLDAFLAETGLDQLLSDTIVGGVRAVPSIDQPVLAAFEEASAA